MAQFKTSDMKVCTRLRVEHGKYPVASLSGGYLQPKTYVYAESEEEINKLLEIPATAEEQTVESGMEKTSNGFTIFKKRGRPKKGA